VATRRHTVCHRLHPAELHSRLQEGASLALDSLDSVDELHPPIARLAEAIERELRTRVQANVYASWTSTEGFGVHWDDHDTVILQLDGAKRWRIYGTTRPFPLYRDIEDPGEAPTQPVSELVLKPGDVLGTRRLKSRASQAGRSKRDGRSNARWRQATEETVMARSNPRTGTAKLRREFSALAALGVLLVIGGLVG
jgi:hypothetical protein